MSPDSLPAPSISPVLATLFAIGGTILGLLISNGFQFWFLNRRISADGDLAERKFEFDKKLAEKKFELDRSLAERKHAIDLDLARRQRSFDLAEQVLAGFHEFREVMRWVRSPLSSGGEGSTRPRAERETPEASSLADAYFVAIERLSKHREKFAALMSHKHKMFFSFGPEIEVPFDKIDRAVARVTSAAKMLIEDAGRPSLQTDQKLWKELRSNIWWHDLSSDPIDLEIASAIGALEAICRKQLSASISSAPSG